MDSMKAAVIHHPGGPEVLSSNVDRMGQADPNTDPTDEAGQKNLRELCEPLHTDPTSGARHHARLTVTFDQSPA
jgi:hypothetical protein